MKDFSTLGSRAYIAIYFYNYYIFFVVYSTLVYATVNHIYFENESRALCCVGAIFQDTLLILQATVVLLTYRPGVLLFTSRSLGLFVIDEPKWYCNLAHVTAVDLLKAA